MNFDLNRMKRSDQVIAVCGAILFICLFLPFFHIDLGPYGSAHVSGHGAGFLSWAGLWLGFLAGGLGFFAALGVAWPAQIPVTKTIATLAISALATLFLVLKLLIGFHSVSRSFGLFVAVIAVIVEVVFAALAFKESGEKLPTKADFQNLGGTSGSSSTTTSTTTSTTPGAGAGYVPPPTSGTPAPVEPPASWQSPQPPTEA